MHVRAIRVLAPRVLYVPEAQGSLPRRRPHALYVPGTRSFGRTVRTACRGTPHAGKPCARGCSHFLFEMPGGQDRYALKLDGSEGGCVEHAARGTCEVTTAGAARTCLTGPLVTSPSCYRPCTPERRQLGATTTTTGAASTTGEVDGSTQLAAAVGLRKYYFLAAALLLCVAYALRGRRSSSRGSYKRLDHLG